MGHHLDPPRHWPSPGRLDERQRHHRLPTGGSVTLNPAHSRRTSTGLRPSQPRSASMALPSDRIVSLLPSGTDIVCALGLASRYMMTTMHHHYPTPPPLTSCHAPSCASLQCYNRSGWLCSCVHDTALQWRFAFRQHFLRVEENARQLG